MRVIFFSLILFLIGCSEKQLTFDEKITKIEIGMTDRQIDSLLGKPKFIERGVKFLSDTKIGAVGQLLNITWYYNKTEIDTFEYFTNEEELVTSAVYKTYYDYYVNNEKTTRQVYNSVEVGGYLYLTGDGKITDKEFYDWSRKIKGRARRIQVYSRNARPREVQIDQDKYQIVEYREVYKLTKTFGVVFDASQNRIIQSGFYPVDIKQLERKKNGMMVDSMQCSVEG